MSMTAKSVIIDITNNYGAIGYMSLRSMDFKLAGNLIAVSSSDITCYGDVYDWNSFYDVENAFITALSKVGSHTDAAWQVDASSNKRIICVFGSSITFDEIVINNAHHNGGNTNLGIQNVKITVSSDAIFDKTYNAAVSNSIIIYDSTFDQHVTSDVQDDQILTLINMPVVWLTGWKKRRKLTIDNSNIDSDLTHFPVPIVLSSGAGQAVITDVDDNFSGIDGDTPNKSLWTGIENASILSNKLRQTSSDRSNANLNSIFKLSGDFDIQVDYDIVDQTNTDLQVRLNVFFSGSVYFRVFWHSSGRTYLHWGGIGGSGSDYTTTDYVTGKFRIVRSGTNCTAYMWNGSSWSTLLSAKNIGNQDFNINVSVITNQTNLYVVDWDNFVVTTGTIIWPAGTGGKDVTNIFRELEYTKGVDDTFTGDDGDLPNSDLWKVVGSQSPVIATNKLRSYITNAAIDNQFAISKFHLTGDFDIQIDFDMVTYSATNNFLFGFIIRQDSTNYLIFQRKYSSSHKYVVNTKLSGSWGTESQVATSDSFGKLQIIRSGSTITTNRWNGSGWTLVNSRTFVSGDLSVRINTQTTAVQNLTVDYDNFTVNSGTIVWPNNTHPNRKKIAVTKDNGISELYGEIEQFEPEEEKAVIWVSKDDFVLSSSENTILYLYFDSEHADNPLIGELNDWIETTEITGDDFSNLNSSYWRFPTIASQDLLSHDATNNRLKFNRNESALYTCNIKSNFVLTGDFDIQIDFGLEAPMGSANNHAAGIKVTGSGFAAYTIRYGSGTNGYYAAITGETSNWIGDNDVIGKLRITRVGTSVKVYYLNGSSSWVLRLTGTNTDIDDLYVYLFARQQSSTLLDSWIDNFVITSGTVLIRPAKQVWDSSNKGVWNLSQSPNGDVADSILDSSNLNNHGNPVGTMLTEDLVSGLIGKGIDFDGIDDAIEIQNHANLQPIEKITYFALVHSEDWSVDLDNRRFVSCIQTGGFGIDGNAGNILRALVYSDGAYRATPDYDYSGLSSGYHLFLCTYDGITLKLYVDGILEGSLSHTGVISYATSSVPLIIAAESDATQAIAPWYDGKISFVGVADTDRSAAYVKALWNALSDNLITFEDTSWLDYDNRVKIEIDNTNIDSDLTHFPIPIVLGTSVGQSSQDVSEIFDALVYDDVDDDFTGDDDDLPNPDLWSVSGPASIQSNKLSMDIDAGSGSTTPQVNSNFRLSGNFDIQIDWAVPGLTHVWGCFVHLRLYGDGWDVSWIRGTNFTNEHISVAENGSVVWSNGTTIDSGKFRITRVGSLLTFYYDMSGSWTQAHTITTDTSDLKIRFYSSHYHDYPGIDANLDNFTVNSGSIVWPENTNPNRKKIAITKEDGIDELYGEIEHWNSTDEKAVIWVSKDDFDIKSFEATNLYLYYDASHIQNKMIGNTQEWNETDLITGDDFTGTDDDPPNIDLWGSVSGDMKISNNSLRSDNPGVGVNTVESSFELIGDFEIQIDWDITSLAISSAGAYNGPWLQVGNGIGWLRLFRWNTVDKGNIVGYFTNTIGWNDFDTPSAFTSGTFVITRIGSILNISVSGENWSSISFNSDDCKVILMNYRDAGLPTYDVSFDNFLINSGTVLINPSQRVWDDNFKAVYHMAQNPSGGADSILDSTININHGTPNGTMLTEDLVDGEIGKAIEFDGTDDYIDCGLGSSIANIFAGGGTVLVSFNASGWGEGSWGRLIHKGVVAANTSSTQIYLQNDASQENLKFLRSFSTDNGQWSIPISSLALSTEYNLAIIYDEDSISNDPVIYLNAVSQIVTEDDNPVGSASTDESQNLIIGARGTDREFEGVIGFLGFVDGELSAAWIKTTNYALKDNLLTFGFAEEGIAALIDMALDIKAYQDYAQDIKSDLILAAYTTDDAQMSLTAYLQHISDLKTDLSLYGSIFQDMLFDAFVAGTIKEDLKTELAAYFQVLENGKLDLKTFGEIIDRLPLDLKVAVEIREDGKLDFNTAYLALADLKQFMELTQSIIDGNIPLDFALGDGIIFKDNKMDLDVGDGNKKEDVGLHLVVVGATPIFKAVYALHLESAIKEVS